jgi:hypothetical protein
MKRRRWFLILAVGLAVAWTAWLGYQAWTTADPVVVSRPQVMVAPLVVEADLAADHSNPRGATIRQIYRGDGVRGLAAEGQSIRVRDVADLAAGAYILALRDTDIAGEYAVVAVPGSAGFARGARRTPVYPATESTRVQTREALRQFQRIMQP